MRPAARTLGPVECCARYKNNKKCDRLTTLALHFLRAARCTFQMLSARIDSGKNLLPSCPSPLVPAKEDKYLLPWSIDGSVIGKCIDT